MKPMRATRGQRGLLSTFVETALMYEAVLAAASKAEQHAGEPCPKMEASSHRGVNAAVAPPLPIGCFVGPVSYG